MSISKKNVLSSRYSHFLNALFIWLSCVFYFNCNVCVCVHRKWIKINDWMIIKKRKTYHSTTDVAAENCCLLTSLPWSLPRYSLFFNFNTVHFFVRHLNLDRIYARFHLNLFTKFFTNYFFSRQINEFFSISLSFFSFEQ